MFVLTIRAEKRIVVMRSLIKFVFLFFVFCFFLGVILCGVAVHLWRAKADVPLHVGGHDKSREEDGRNAVAHQIGGREKQREKAAENEEDGDEDLFD